MPIKKKPECAVFIFSDTWGEIDTVLPLIFDIKKKSKLKVISIFTETQTLKQKDKFIDLFKILKNCTDEIFDFKFILRKNFIQLFLNLFFFDIKNFFKIILFPILKRNISPINQKFYLNEVKKKYKIKYIFAGHTKVLIKNWFFENNSKVLLFPQALTLRGVNFSKNRNFNYKIYNRERHQKYYNHKIYPKNSIFLTIDKNESKYFRKYLPNKIFNIINIGYQRLSTNWKQIKIKYKEKLKKKHILIILGKEWYLGSENLRKKLIEIFNVAYKLNVNVKYKFHPRSTFDLSKEKKKFNKIKIEEAKNSILTEALNALVAITTSKTGSCFDCISANVPVLDYYSLNNGLKENTQDEFKINGKITTLYRYYNFVLPINNTKELNLKLSKILTSYEFRKKILKEQKKNFQFYLKGNKIKKIVDVIN